MTGPLIVRWWRYGGAHAERKAGRDFNRAERRLASPNVNSSVSVFRMKLDPRVAHGPVPWFIALVGPEDEVAPLLSRVRHGKGCAEPEPGLNEAVLNRRLAHLRETLAKGHEFGRKTYLAGADLDRSGEMEPRRPQG